MTTEDKIKEEFEAEFQESINGKRFLADSIFKTDLYIFYEAGYLALLNSLEPYGVWHEGASIEESDYFPPSMTPGECEKCIQLYRLPEGVTKQ